MPSFLYTYMRCLFFLYIAYFRLSKRRAPALLSPAGPRAHADFASESYWIYLQVVVQHQRRYLEVGPQGLRYALPKLVLASELSASRSDPPPFPGYTGYIVRRRVSRVPRASEVPMGIPGTTGIRLCMPRKPVPIHGYPGYPSVELRCSSLAL